MMAIKRILCPVDFSEHSRHAFDHAVAIAHRYESAITAMYVFPQVLVAGTDPGAPVVEPVGLTESDRERLLAQLKMFTAAEVPSGMAVDHVIKQGNAVAHILAQARAIPADLLTIGTHGRSGFERLVLGSITEKVLRKAPCPVLVVPRRHPDAVPASPVIFKRIVCPVDFSDCAMTALRYAISLAQEADASLTVLSVMTYELAVTPDMYGAILIEDRETLGEFRRRQEEEARQRLRDAIPDGVRDYCEVTTLVTSGKPSLEILRVAREVESDVIIMGVRGRGAADMMLFGSTTNHVVREAVCPVLTVPAS